MNDTTYFNPGNTVVDTAAPAADQVPQQAAQRFSIVYFNDERDNVPQSKRPTWTEFIQAFGKHTIRPQKKGGVWSPARYKTGTNRGNANVECISMLVADVDGGKAFADLKAKLDAYHYLAHSSFSHTPDKPKYRVILPLNQPVPVADWALVWARFNAMLEGVNDPSTKDPARIYFLPSHPENAPGHFIATGVGKLLDISDLPELPIEVVTAATRSSIKHYNKVRIDGIEEIPEDPLNPAEGLSRAVERCAFMQWASAPQNQNDVSNPLWMAMVSNACRFEGSEEWIHEASCHYDDYSDAETDGLIGRCRSSTAPITCATIQGYGFTGCPTGGCMKPSGKGVTLAPAGLWMRCGSPIASPAHLPSSLLADGADARASNPERYVEGFLIRDDAVYKMCKQDDKMVPVKISSFIDIAAQTRDETQGNWGLLVTVKDPDGNMHEWAMPKEMLPYPSTWKAELLKMGADIFQQGKQDHLY